ncbi:MAG: TonB-dependent receptor [Massilia sp.]
MTGNVSMAQQTATPPAPSAKTAPADEITTVLVIGARASQQSAIARKKNAATAQDSIIAEDVGAFPDRNVADAISRIAGVALDRGDYGEGVSVSIRGNGPDLTRVEMDGQGVQAAGGADGLNNMTAGSDGGRGVEMRNLSSDLIKSVDVVKGSTAEMTEGSLGGAIIIKTRTGLDFAKPYYSLRLAANQNSINKKITPDMNLVLTNKFLDNRLGILLNVTKTVSSNENHNIGMGGSNNQIGPVRNIDFDNSPEKTFSFQPQTINTSNPLATTPLVTSTLAAGGTFKSATPQELVTKSAGAKSKAECATLFPQFTVAEQNAFPTASNNRTNAINQRQLELLTCLNQWNDYTPNLIRPFVNRAEDSRLSGDLRFDFKVNNNLSVYLKYNGSRNTVTSYTESSGYGDPSFNGTGTFTDVAATGARTPISGNYAFYDTPSFRSGGPIANGTVTNIIPGTVKVDAAHHVIAYHISDGGASSNSTLIESGTDTQYTQGGGTYKNGGFKAELMIGSSHSEFYRMERRLGIGFTTGEVAYDLLPNGLWNTTTLAPGKSDLTAVDNYWNPAAPVAAAAVVASATTKASPAYTASQTASYTPRVGLTMQNPRIIDTGEKTMKLDTSYSLNDKIPFFTLLKAGLNFRNTDVAAYYTGGFTIRDPVGTYGSASYVPGLYMPTNNFRSTFQACVDTPGSLGAGGQPCAYGYTPSADPAHALEGNYVLTKAQYLNAIATSLTYPNSRYFNSDPNRPANLQDGWYTLDINKFYNAIGVQNYNLDCIKFCMGSDGVMREQAKTAMSEKVKAAYVSADFELDHIPFTTRSLPFGMEIDGNIGYRMINTAVAAQGTMTFVTIAKTAAYNPLDRENAAGITTRTFRQSSSIQATNNDFMPVYNVALWAIPSKLVLRYNRAKTIARPGVGRLLPAGTCTYDERNVGLLDTDGSETDMSCGNSILGNPNLKPQTNTNQNWSLEWYANKDTMLSVSYFKQEGKVGAPTAVENVSGTKLFEGADVNDPGTGASLADTEFTFRRYTNQTPSTRRGLEFSSKTAFTFLPSVLKYTGLDANYTRVRSALASGQILDLVTGSEMPLRGEPKYSYNASLWYDDGAFSARLALQVVAPVFNCISGCENTAVNNYPVIGLNTVRAPVYAPALPNFSIGTRYIDAKAAYKFKNGIEVFIEGRNLNSSHTGSNTGGYGNYADGTAQRLNDKYAGRKLMIGLNIKSL